MNLDELRRAVAGIHWFQSFEIVPGVVSDGQKDMRRLAPYYGVPDDLQGKRILDIGCADGFFSFLAESRGAEVMAIDTLPRRGFFLAHEARKSRVEFRHMSVYELSPQDLGIFDIVFFFGVYYHLKHPLLALDNIAKITKEYALIESEVLDIDEYLARLENRPDSHHGEDASLRESCQFVGDSSLNYDSSNWWIPSTQSLLHMAFASGFPELQLVSGYDGRRAVIKAAKSQSCAGTFLNEDLFVMIDIPAPQECLRETVTIAGWATSQLHPTDGINEISVFLDHIDDQNALLGRAEYPLPRPDVALTFTDDYEQTGFSLSCDLRHTTPGPHTLYCRASGPYGWNYRSVPIVVGDLP